MGTKTAAKPLTDGERLRLASRVDGWKAIVLENPFKPPVEILSGVVGRFSIGLHTDIYVAPNILRIMVADELGHLIDGTGELGFRPRHRAEFGILYKRAMKDLRGPSIQKLGEGRTEIRRLLRKTPAR